MVAINSSNNAIWSNDFFSVLFLGASKRQAVLLNEPQEFITFKPEIGLDFSVGQGCLLSKQQRLEKAEPKEQMALEKTLKALKRQKFACQSDAEKAAQEAFSKARYHKVSELQIEAVRKHSQAGRPKANQSGEISHWVIATASFEADRAKLGQMELRGACYIIATNVPAEALSAAEVLQIYSEQSKVERGFRFLKDPMFFTSGMFLKKPERLQGLLMVMTLALLVYTLAERKLRRYLSEHNESLPNQIKQETKTPTLRWVFQMLDGINRVKLTLPGQAPQILCEGLNDTKTKAIKCFGDSVAKYYLISYQEACSM